LPAALPAADYERLLPDLEFVPLPLGWAVYEAGGKLEYVYFPTPGIVSLLYVMEDGSSAEMAVTGNDGLAGIALFMCGGSTPSRAVVQSAGYAYRLRAVVYKGNSSKAVSYSVSGATLYSGTDYPDVANRGVQPPLFRGAATVPLAVVESGQAPVQ
jgi:hypothetical protein